MKCTPFWSCYWFRIGSHNSNPLLILHIYVFQSGIRFSLVLQLLFNCADSVSKMVIHRILMLLIGSITLLFRWYLLAYGMMDIHPLVLFPFCYVLLSEWKILLDLLGKFSFLYHDDAIYCSSLIDFIAVQNITVLWILLSVILSFLFCPWASSSMNLAFF